MGWIQVGVCAALVLLAAAGGPVVAEEDPAPATGVTPEERDAALAKAFRYLDDELWKMQAGGSPRKPYACAVAGWAYLIASAKAGKKLPARTRQIERIRDELERYADEVARLYERDDKKRKKEERRRPRGPPGMPDMMGIRTAQYVWPLSMAAHFFAESAARGKKRSASKKVLRTIVRALEAAQQENGGWGHDDASREGMGLPPIRIPKPGGGSLTYPGTLLAASNCALSALGVAHRVLGTTKKAKSLARGRAYFEASQNGDGSFPYDPAQKHDMDFGGAMAGGIEVARTGGAIYALHCAGAPPGDPVVAKAIRSVDADLSLLHEGHGSACMALQLGALASRVRGDEAWARFRGTFFRRILDRQGEDGGFRCACKGGTMAVTCDTRELPGIRMPGYVAQQRVYVTAIYALVLALDRDATRSVPARKPKDAPVVTGK
jgi:hypothetical protein